MGVLVPTGSVGVKVNHGFTVSVSENRYKKYGAPQLDFIFTAGSIENVVTSENPISFVRNSPATFYDSSGILRTVSANEPRFDHNSITGEKLGLLIEESRTNQSTNSENALTWQNIGGQTTNVQSDITTAPDGSISADNIFAASGTRPAKSAFDTGSSFDVLNNQYLILSVFAKKVPGSKFGFLNLNINLAGSGVPRVNFNLTTGESTEHGDNQGYSEEIGNGWYRLVAYYQNTTGSTQTWSNTNTVRFFPVENSTDQIASGAGTGSTTDGTYVWGRQIEVAGAPFASSYIPTLPTFTSRASVATFYNENGTISTASTDVARNNAYFPNENGVMTDVGLLLESAATNLLLHSEQFGLYSPSEVDVRPNNNLAPDLSFTAGSIVETTATDYHQLFLYPIQATGNITVSGFIKNKQGTRNALLKFNDGTNDLGFYFNPSSGNTVGVLTGAGTTEPINYGSQKLGNDWYRIYVSGNVSSTGGASSLHIIDNSTYSTHAGTGTDGFYVWGFQMEQNVYPTSYIETPATFSSRSQTNSDSASFYQSDGTIGYAATNVARDNAYLPDENGTFYPAGLLLEEERTNLHVGSTTDALNQGIVGLTQGSVTATDPTGSTSTVETWTVDTSAGEHDGYRFYNNTYVDFTWSLFVKANGITRIQVSASQRDNASYIEVDLTDGSIINQTDSYATATPIGGGWVRISSTKIADRAHGPGFWLLDSSGNRSFTGNGTDGIYVWGIQLEQQSGALFPTSYIPTTSSTATRGRDFISSGITSTRSADVSSGVTSTRQADDAIISGIAFSSFYNLTEGSFFVHGGPDQINSSSNQFLLCPSDGSNSDQTRIKVNAGVSSVTFNVRVGSVQQANITINSVVAGNNDSKIAARYGVNDFRIDAQSSSGIDASGTVSSSLTQLAIGSRTNDRYLNGHIRRLTYWPTKLSDAQLERITQQ